MNRETSELLESLLALIERKALPVGTTRTWKGGDYIKTDKGWRKVATGRGSHSRVAPMEATDDAEIAAWAQNSYPEKGDAAFLVHGTTTPGGLAGDIFGGLKAHFVARPFIMDIQRVLADMRDEVAVSIKSQEDARKLYNKHAEDFLRAMYKAHGNGKKPYGSNYDAVEKWVKSKVKK